MVFTEKEMTAMEDVFFCAVLDEDYEKLRPLLADAWEKIRDIQDDSKGNLVYLIFSMH